MDRCGKCSDAGEGDTPDEEEGKEHDHDHHHHGISHEEEATLTK